MGPARARSGLLAASVILFDLAMASGMCAMIFDTTNSEGSLRDVDVVVKHVSVSPHPLTSSAPTEDSVDLSDFLQLRYPTDPYDIARFDGCRVVRLSTEDVSNANTPPVQALACKPMLSSAVRSTFENINLYSIGLWQIVK